VAPGRAKIEDHEYVRNGVAEIFMEVEPLAGHRHVEITAHRTRVDWAEFIKGMLDERYPDATKVRLIMDNLNTHSIASLYEAFPPVEARRRIDLGMMRDEGSASEAERNNRASKTIWRFTTAQARNKPKRLYPKL